MSNNRPKFLKTPLTSEEKEIKAERFLNFESNKDVKTLPQEEKVKSRVFKKEAVKVLSLRFPKSLAEDVTEISALTGLSVNGICIELLRPAVKQKLKELTED